MGAASPSSRASSARRGVDNEILLQDDREQIVEMNNGCICCTVRGDLVRILGDLRTKREDGTLAFDRVIIETTGMADPGPVAQTFFMEERISEYYLLDSIVTVVDAMHGARQLDEFTETQEQFAFADRILLSKADLASAPDVEMLRHRLARVNPRAPIKPVHCGVAPIDEILDVDPAFLEDAEHEHTDAVRSFVFRAERPFDGRLLEEFLSALIQVHGADMLRYKGALHLEGNPNRVVFQGVHMLMGGDVGKPWGADEKRESKLVFIGRNLPEDLFIEGLEQCLVKVQ
jgi:G3E family GTPase